MEVSKGNKKLHFILNEKHILVFKIYGRNQIKWITCVLCSPLVSKIWSGPKCLGGFGLKNHSWQHRFHPVSIWWWHILHSRYCKKFSNKYNLVLTLTLLCVGGSSTTHTGSRFLWWHSICRSRLHFAFQYVCVLLALGRSWWAGHSDQSLFNRQSVQLWPGHQSVHINDPIGLYNYTCI